MSVIGIDQSYSGFAIATEEEVRVHNFPLSKYPSDAHRLEHIYSWFHNMLVYDNGVEFVTMEGYAPGAKFGREMAGELGGAVKIACARAGVPVVAVAPTTLKKFVTGRGNAKKNEMLLGVYKRWGEEFTNDNAADAFSLRQFGRAYWKDDVANLLVAQIKVVKEFRDKHPR